MTDNSIILLRGWYKGVHMNFPFRPCIYSDRNWLDFIQSFKCDWRSEVLRHQTKESCINTLNELRLDIFLKFKNNCYTQRQMRRHWRQNYLKNVYRWFCSIYYLDKYKHIENDDQNGYEWLTQAQIDETTPGIEPQVYDFCKLCNEIAVKKCGGCLTAYYCCGGHQLEDWKQHRVECRLLQLEKYQQLSKKYHTNHERLTILCQSKIGEMKQTTNLTQQNDKRTEITQIIKKQIKLKDNRINAEESIDKIIKILDKYDVSDKVLEILERP